MAWKPYLAPVAIGLGLFAAIAFGIGLTGWVLWSLFGRWF